MTKKSLMVLTALLLRIILLLGSASEVVAIPNSWEVSTEDKPFEYLGARFIIEPPSGFALLEAAILTESLAEEQGGASARFAYTNADDEMFRVHITAGAAKELINCGEPVHVNDINAFYNMEQNAASYTQEDFLITIDMLDTDKEVLLELVGSVLLMR